MSSVRRENASSILVPAVWLVVLGLAYWNWTLFATPVDTSPIAAPAGDSRAAGAKDAEIAMPAAPPGQLTETTSRPLFTASRRPFEQKAEAPPPPPVEVAKPATPPDHLKLVGVVRLGGGLEKALIRSSADVPGRWVPVGDSVDGWQVREVSIDKAVVEMGGQTYELRLAYDAAGASKPPSANP